MCICVGMCMGAWADAVVDARWPKHAWADAVVDARWPKHASLCITPYVNQLQSNATSDACRGVRLQDTPY